MSTEKTVPVRGPTHFPIPYRIPIKKTILVVGATGAQGRPVVSSLLAPQDDGTPSPYVVRALTRDPTSAEAQSLAALGAELFQGKFDDIDSVAAAFKGCYGTFVNTDTFSVGEQGEIYAGIKIFEQAHRTPQMKHFIWSSLDYGSKLGKFNPRYKCCHFDSKGPVADFLKAHPSAGDGDSLTWSIITTGPYMENLNATLLGPLAERENGAVVWATPTGDGHIPAISVEDIGWWVRYTFDHRAETSGQELKIATEFMTIDQLVETFTRVTGTPAIRKRMSVEEYSKLYPDYYNRAVIKNEPDGPTVGDLFTGMWRVWGDDLMTRDMDWVRKTHPTGYTLESFIREKGFDGKLNLDLQFLKDSHLGRNNVV